jgi:hypothetical protein
LAIALRLAASSGGTPSRILRTGTSIFLPVRVTGMAGTWMIRSGTCRAVYWLRSRSVIVRRSASSSTAPSSSVTNSGMKNRPPGRSRLTMRAPLICVTDSSAA